MILGLKQDARDLLAEDAVPYTLPDDSLVLAMHQGYMFFFFPTVAVDSPEVLTYIEGEESARDNERRRGRPAKWPDLVSWLTTELAGTAMMIRSEEARRS